MSPRIWFSSGASHPSTEWESSPPKGKMLNMVDDESYPVYDSQVGLVFQKPFTPEETRLDHQASVYQDICDTYRELRTHPVIEAFRNEFHCPGMGYMKVLDTIFWHLGGILEKEGEL